MPNLLTDIPESLPDELTEILARSDHVRIERIVSTGHASPPGFWYDQAEAEWVLLLQGTARLRIKGDSEDRELKPGDHVLIPPHQKHRVEWTSEEEPTVWIAVFFTA